MPASPGELSIVEGCRSGQAEAQDRFFRTYAQYVERTISRLIGPTQHLEDLVQTTFIEALRSFHRYRGEASVKTWVTRIAVHVVHHQLRRGLRRTVSLELIGADDEPRDRSPSPERVFGDRQVASRLHLLLDRVAPKKRIAFLLYTIEGHSIEEVAALTSSGIAATKSRIWFARRELIALVKHDPKLRDLAATLAEQGPGDA